MSGTVLTTELVTFGIGVFIAIAGLWWRVEAKIAAAEETAGLKGLLAQTKAETVAAEFSKYQIHVAEHYASKSGMREMRDEIVGALTAMNGSLGRLNDRIDRFAEPTRRTRDGEK